MSVDLSVVRKSPLKIVADDFVNITGTPQGKIIFKKDSNTDFYDVELDGKFVCTAIFNEVKVLTDEPSLPFLSEIALNSNASNYDNMLRVANELTKLIKDTYVYDYQDGDFVSEQQDGEWHSPVEWYKGEKGVLLRFGIEWNDIVWARFAPRTSGKDQEAIAKAFIYREASYILLSTDFITDSIETWAKEQLPERTFTLCNVLNPDEDKKYDSLHVVHSGNEYFALLRIA